MRRIVIIFVLALAGARLSCAQNCQPYWVGIPTSHLPEYPEIGFETGISDEGPSLWAWSVHHLSRWDGLRWNSVSLTGISSEARFAGIKFLDEGLGPKAYVLTYTIILPAGQIDWATYRRIDGVWRAMPRGIWNSQNPEPLTSMDLGDGMHIYGVMGTIVVKWRGANWDLVGYAQGGDVLDLVPFNYGTGQRLYAMGGAWHVGGSIGSFARFDGAIWEFPGGVPQGSRAYPRTTTVFDWGQGPRLVAAGAVPFGSQDFATIATFDGTSWTIVGHTQLPIFYTPGIGPVGLFDDGRGTAVYVTGDFPDMNGVPARAIARWDGHTWEALSGGGLQGGTCFCDRSSVIQMDTPRGRSLIVVGEGVTGAAGGVSPYAVQYVGCPNCYANCDLSKSEPTLNVNDFICFLNAYARKDPYANCDGSAAIPGITIADFQCFLNKFAAGCP